MAQLTAQVVSDGADLVIYSRVGERRIVPLAIYNGRRYRRGIHIEMSDWKESSGWQGVAVSSALDRTELEIAPCSEEHVNLEITSSVATENNEPCDDCLCAVFHANLRFDGCNRSPVRIALVLLGNQCKAARLECDLPCC